MLMRFVLVGIAILVLAAAGLWAVWVMVESARRCRRSITDLRDGLSRLAGEVSHIEERLDHHQRLLNQHRARTAGELPNWRESISGLPPERR